MTHDASDPNLDPKISDDLADEHVFAAKRTLACHVLNDLATEIEHALTQAALPTDVFFAVPSSGRALLTFATPGDPPDDVWNRVSDIVCDVVGRKIGMGGLTSTEVPSAVVRASVRVADVSGACDAAPAAG